MNVPWSDTEVRRLREALASVTSIPQARQVAEKIRRGMSKTALDQVCKKKLGKSLAQLVHANVNGGDPGPETHDTVPEMRAVTPAQVAAAAADGVQTIGEDIPVEEGEVEFETTTAGVALESQAPSDVTSASSTAATESAEQSREPEPPSDLDRLVKLIKLVKNRTFSLEELCDRLDMPPRRARELVEQAKSNGFNVDIDGPIIGRRPAEESSEIHSIVEQPGETHVFAVISDIHFGSKYHLRGPMLDFIAKAYARGVRTILCPGDILDGIYRHGRWELTHHGFDEQANEAAEGLPRYPGLQYHGIIGNHDETFEKESGIAVVSALRDVFARHGRDDFHLYGARGAYLRLKAPDDARGLLVHLWHPLKGPAYALTYGMQKKVEGYAPGGKPDVLLTGHWHQAAYFCTRGVHAMSCGTWQGGGSAFGKSLAGAPTIGGWTIEYALTASGTVREFAPKWTAYFEREEAREVGLG